MVNFGLQGCWHNALESEQKLPADFAQMVNCGSDLRSQDHRPASQAGSGATRSCSITTVVPDGPVKRYSLSQVLKMSQNPCPSVPTDEKPRSSVACGSLSIEMPVP